jgi:hypothetical protein
LADKHNQEAANRMSDRVVVSGQRAHSLEGGEIQATALAEGRNFTGAVQLPAAARASRVAGMPSVYLLLVSAFLLIAPERATAFEADVHYGLTYWLALQAGFEPLEAQIIATGDERVDSGDMPYIDLVAMYACLHRDEVSARRAGEHHFPSAGKIPGLPETRSVAPNSSAARQAALVAIEAGAAQAQFRLLQLGEGLHALQDSWSNQGVPSVPQLGDVPSACDSRLAWGHPETRGGPASHRADLTMYWPEDTVAMAQATYDILKQYPSISGAQRNVRNWEEIRPELDGFIKAPTKTEKAHWFAAHGMDDVSFLEGISLPDGAEAFLQHWPGLKLPPLSTEVSSQHAIDAQLLDFYNRFFARWLSGEDFAAAVAEFSKAPDTSGGTAGATMSPEQLESQLKLWRLRDHGRVAELALQRERLTAEERAAIDALAKQPDAYVRYEPLSSAYYPLLPVSDDKDVSPLLPFFIGMVSPNAGRPRAIAVAKFRHAPYNIVEVISENIDSQWRVTSITSIVDH